MKQNKFGVKRFYFLLVAVVFMAMSCKKLVEKPLSFVEPADFYTTPGQVEAAFAASLNSLWNYWGGYGYGFGAFINDDQNYGGDLVIPHDHGADIWNAHYTALLNLNAAISAMKKGNLAAVASQEELDLLMGQAKFLRAYNYFMLVRMFGNLPLITEDTPDPVTNPITRTDYHDVYALIVADFTEAAQKLPATWPEANQGRPTSDAAKGLLAKTYLTMATYPMNDQTNYAKAADYAKQVIDGNRYKLVHDIRDVFTLGTKYGPENMWSFNSNYADLNTDPQIYRPGLLGGWGDIKVQPEWERAVPTSARKDAYVLYKIDGVRYESWASDQYPFVKKFMYDDEGDFDASRSIMNFPIIRYADVLLIYAEAANMVAAGATAPQEAVDAINQVIDRANDYAPNAEHPLLNASMEKDAFDAAVIEERNQELCFENDRWFDLIRKHILKEKSIEAIQVNFSDNDYLFPIPDNDILLNPDLGQNEGY